MTILMFSPGRGVETPACRFAHSAAMLASRNNPPATSCLSRADRAWVDGLFAGAYFHVHGRGIHIV